MITYERRLERMLLVMLPLFLLLLLFHLMIAIFGPFLVSIAHRSRLWRSGPLTLPNVGPRLERALLVVL